MGSLAMENPAVFPNRAEAVEDVFERTSGAVSVIYGIIYWGILAIGLAAPIAGAVWGTLR